MEDLATIKRPTKPKTAFHYYKSQTVNRNRNGRKNRNYRLEWNSLCSSAKQVYEDKMRRDRKRFDKEMMEYNSIVMGESGGGSSLGDKDWSGDRGNRGERPGGIERNRYAEEKNDGLRSIDSGQIKAKNVKDVTYISGYLDKDCKKSDMPLYVSGYLDKDSKKSDMPLYVSGYMEKGRKKMRSSSAARSPEEEERHWKRKQDKEEHGSRKIFVGKEMTRKSNGNKEFSQECARNVSHEELPKYDVSTAALDKLSSQNIFDSHCHLDFIFTRLKAPHRVTEGYLNVSPKTFSDFKSQYTKDIHKNFEGCVTNFCDPKQWNGLQVIPELIQGLEKEPGIYYTVGCHPHFSESMMSNKSRDKLEGLIKRGNGKGGRCVAIGECGLDLSSNPNKRKTPLEAQESVFKFQLKLAIKLNFPLVLHIREAEEEAYQVMQDIRLPSNHPIHRHCFNDSWAVCKTWMRKFPNSFIGLTNLLLKPNVKHLHKIARLIPLDRLILETDSPYFPPPQVHHQSRDYPRDMSHPGDVVHVAAQVAALRKESLENVLAANRRNIATLYSIKEMPGKSRMDGRKR